MNPYSLRRSLNTLEAGRVSRYHAAPTVQAQTVGHHSFGVAVFVMYLTGGTASAALLFAALNHDSAEIFTGDVPFTTKRSHPEAKALFDSLETEAYEKNLIPMPALTPAEQAILKMADTMEGLAWSYKTEAHGGPVTLRWSAALGQAIIKFTPVLSDTPQVLDRARDFSRNANQSTSNLYT